MVRSCNKGALSRPQISKQGRLQRRRRIPGSFIAARLVVHYARGCRPHRAHCKVLRGTAPSTVPAPTVPLGAHSGHPRTLLVAENSVHTRDFIGGYLAGFHKKRRGRTEQNRTSRRATS